MWCFSQDPRTPFKPFKWRKLDLGRMVTRLPKLSISCATDGTKLLVKSVCETKPKSSFSVWAHTFVPGQLANQDDGKLETHFGNLLNPLGAQKQGYHLTRPQSSPSCLYSLIITTNTNNERRLGTSQRISPLRCRRYLLFSVMLFYNKLGWKSVNLSHDHFSPYKEGRRCY